MPLVGALNEDMRNAMETQFASALASARLRPAPLVDTIDLGLGFQIMMIRRILLGGGGAVAIAAAPRTLLLALGVETAEADRIASPPAVQDRTAAACAM